MAAAAAPGRHRALRRTGFPTLQDEDWRFTNLARWPSCRSNPPLNRPTMTTPKRRWKNTFRPLPGTRLVFVNGQYSMALSSVQDCPTA